MTDFVLVPGAWHGAWTFELVVPLLERAGHRVHALTLTGLGPNDDQAAVSANLDTHANDVLRCLDRALLEDVTLVGHSYGGMVISAAADRADGRISRLVHLDAYVPEDGQSCWSATSDEYRALFAQGAGPTGHSVSPPWRPPEGGDGRRRPHPLASLMQNVRLTGASDQVRRRDFIYCAGWPDHTPFAALHARLHSDPGWDVYELATGHNAMGEAPKAVADILLGAS